QEEMKKKRQEDVINSAKYYNDADWSDIMGQVHANKGLTADLLGPDVNEDNFAARMAAIIAERRRKFAAQSSTIYTTGWTMKHVRSFSDDQLKDEFDKIRHALANLQSQHLRRSLKRQGVDLEQPDSKKSKSTKPQKTSVPAASRPSSAGVTPDVHQLPFVDTPPASPPHSPKASSHPAVTPNTSKQPSVAPTPPSSFSATTTVTRTSSPRTGNQSSAAGIKTYSTRRKSLGSRKMSSSEVDLNAADTFFIKVLCDDDSDDSDGDINPHYWHAFAAWEIVPTGLGDVNALYFTDKSSKYFTHLREILHLLDRQDLSKLYGMVVNHYEDKPLAGTGMLLWGDLHVLFECTTGGSNTPYPLSASLMKKMLKHKLEIEIDGIGNDMTYAVSINLAAAVFVAVSILKALKTEDLSRKLEVNYVKFQFRGGLLVPNPKDMTIIGTKWVFRNKFDENGVVSRNKARLVSQGYNQQEGIDYEETYAPIARLESIRILLAYAYALDFKLFQMDVKSVFLNGFINEEVYVAQPPGFINFAKPNHVYRLKKALYGLKQTPKA
ncbi:retrovirus-related pol polyprotein from transposon TNT 1-94, partial [Tanacetum coccineum]